MAEIYFEIGNGGQYIYCKTCFCMIPNSKQAEHVGWHDKLKEQK